MNDYITSLEERIEELQQKLAEEQRHWNWVTVNYPYSKNENYTVILEMKVKNLVFGFITSSNKNKDFYTSICTFEEKCSSYTTLPECKQWIEDWYTSMFIKKVHTNDL
jgi:hypothetical protein